LTTQAASAENYGRDDLNPAVFDRRENIKYYESEGAVESLNRWYNDAKEAAFADSLLDGLEVPANLPFVEVGGGSGVQGIQVHRYFGERYIHSDYSTSLVRSARRKGLKSLVVDGLATPFRDASIAGLLLVGPSTIVRDEAARFAQIDECARILAPNGVCIMVTSVIAGSRGQHCLNTRDFDYLAEKGLPVTKVRRWGIVPGRFWSGFVKAQLATVERICSAVGLGVRQVVTCRKTVAPRSGNA
jgi:hypothetical protein